MKLITNKYKIKEYKIKERITLICAISKEEFSANMEITFKPKNLIPELVSVREYFREFKEETAESLAYKIKKEFKKALKTNCKVKIFAESPIHSTVEISK